MNELIFIIHTLFVAIAALASLQIAGALGLTAFVSLTAILANLFVVKQITLCGLTATCADAFIIGSTLGLNLLQEYCGKSAARIALRTTFFLLAFYLVVSQLHLIYLPGLSDFSHYHYLAIVGATPRIVCASFIAYALSQIVDYLLYGFLKRVWTGKWLMLRNGISLATSQLVDTILFTYLGLYGVLSHLESIIVVSYSLKLIAAAIAIPLVSFARTISTIERT